MLSRFRKFILPENDIINHITDNAKILDIGCGINGLSNKINLNSNDNVHVHLNLKLKRI